MFVHIIATLIALVQLRKHKIGRWIPLGIFAMGVVSPITLGSVSSKFSEVQINKSLERKIVNIFLPVSLNICFGCSKEGSVSLRLKTVLLSTHNICFR